MPQAFLTFARNTYINPSRAANGPNMLHMDILVIKEKGKQMIIPFKLAFSFRVTLM